MFTRRYVRRRPYESNPLKSKRSVCATLERALGVRRKANVYADAVDTTAFVVRFTEKTWTDVFAEDSNEHTLMGKYATSVQGTYAQCAELCTQRQGTVSSRDARVDVHYVKTSAKKGTLPVCARDTF